MSEWINWEGGERPLPVTAVVDVALGDGRVVRGFTAGHFYWGHCIPRPECIVKYRIRDKRSEMRAWLEDTRSALVMLDILDDYDCPEFTAKANDLRRDLDELEKIMEGMK